MDTECPICYNSNANCTLICKHSFCLECIKDWYSRKQTSCPVCRNNICFKGMYKYKKHLENKQKENIMQHIFEKYLEYILQNITINSIYYIKFLSQQLYNINTYKQTFNEKEIDVLLCYYITEYKQQKQMFEFSKNKSKKCYVSYNKKNIN